MQKEFLFLSGQIRALQSKLLTLPQMDRMIGARTPEEAFRVLVELQYAQYFDESTRPEDFHRVIRQGILETKQLIQKGTDNDPAFEFVWRELDLNSLKRALKIRLVENGTEIKDFTEENGFSDYGDLTKEQVEAIVFRGEQLDQIPHEYGRAIAKAIAYFEEHADFQQVEFLLDRAHFDFLDRIARKSPHDFLRNLLAFQADVTNIRSAARLILLYETALPAEGFLPYGTFDFSLFKEAKTREALLAALKKTRFEPMLQTLKAETAPEQLLVQIGRALDERFQAFLSDAESGEIGSIQIPLVYLERRLQNARRLKFIMFAKFYGLDPEKIYEVLPTL